MATIFAVKAVLISTAALSTALLLKLSFPALQDFFSSVVPQIWSSLLSWLTPPYLYFVINGIIISIAASSKFQKQQHHQKADEFSEFPATANGPAEVRHDFDVSSDYEAVVLKRPSEIRPDFQMPATVEYGGSEEKGFEVKSKGGVEEREEEDEFVISRSDWEPKRRDFTGFSVKSPENSAPMDKSPGLNFPAEKPPVSVRIGHRKSVKQSPEGHYKPLGVAKPKRHETLESTWKTITEGRAMPLTRHLKKSDTWETHGRNKPDVAATTAPAVKKSETMNDRRSTPSPSPSPSPNSGKLLRKESSLGQDELNRRVEAFIKKFNAEMRLQRQESLNHYMEMIKRGSR